VNQSAGDSNNLRDVIITRQQNSPPPPPPPQVPVPVPNDEIIEEETLILQDFDISHYADSVFVGKGTEAGSEGQIVSNPQISPSILRIVEPTTPNAAQRAGVKVQIWVNFLVNKKGDVEDAKITQILVYNEESEGFKNVDFINYGLMEVTLEAALQWEFRPATDAGEPVKAYSQQVFTYGF
jgi:protein TonB